MVSPVGRVMVSGCSHHCHELDQKHPITFSTNRPEATRTSRGLESLRNFHNFGILAASNAPISAESQILDPPPAAWPDSCEEHDHSPLSPPASLIAEPFDPQDYQYDKRHRPSTPDQQHQSHPIRESQPVYCAFPAHCPRKPFQAFPFLASSLSTSSSSPQRECSPTRNDSAVAGISLGAGGDFEAEASTGAVIKAMTIAGSKTDPLPSPLLRSPTAPTSLIDSWADAYRSPSSRASTTSKAAADPASSSPSYCTRCVVPLIFDISSLDQDESWECCNCASNNKKLGISLC
ncbi:hypothetical protein NEUTE1DRAFT_106405 [Neurospora tetrasperma FGSC 2508]|uniref:Uncharacterized protein n=1 Tax=Neurospora tetrasperma (strain FGSC 2508 / ATCC MYA-4615 / P0657) TaxID=510951 RepID=F8N453_NEUT8|nr:uncharacterized protein NEUTE1DRAFT_106405 [Neurospora tetrasperma FGSC 2508]EGO53496.1 hypothetical protein NEUTE1DRAFT_106405 [Neurospora tetrasperma FGSC 2508]